MKKLIMLAVVGVMTLSSFGRIETKKPLKMTIWRLSCGGVTTGYLECDCSYSYAMLVARGLC